MIKNQPISNDNIERISQFIIDDIQNQPDSDIPELIGMYLENTTGCESLSSDEIEHLIITIESKVDSIQHSVTGDQLSIGIENWPVLAFKIDPPSLT